jgi:hypothetical protein
VEAIPTAAPMAADSTPLGRQGEKGGWRKPRTWDPHVSGGEERRAGAKWSVQLSWRGKRRGKIPKGQKSRIEEFVCLWVKFRKTCELRVISHEACEHRVKFRNISSLSKFNHGHANFFDFGVFLFFFDLRILPLSNTTDQTSLPMPSPLLSLSWCWAPPWLSPMSTVVGDGPWARLQNRAPPPPSLRSATKTHGRCRWEKHRQPSWPPPSPMDDAAGRNATRTPGCLRFRHHRGPLPHCRVLGPPRHHPRWRDPARPPARKVVGGVADAVGTRDGDGDSDAEDLKDSDGWVSSREGSGGAFSRRGLCY